MKKLLFSLFFLISSPVFAWQSESGSAVVSDAAVIVRTSLEATEVLRSDTLSTLYGETRLGGATNYASFNSGGVFSGRNVTSSADTVLFANNQYAAWLRAPGGDGAHFRIGLSANNVFAIASDTTVTGTLSGTNVAVSSTIRVSSDSNLTQVSATNMAVSSNLRVSGNAVLAISTVAGLPAAPGNTGAVRIVTDGSSATDCTAGGGSTYNFCFSNGTAWTDA